MTVKKELDGLSEEVLAIRHTIREDKGREDALVNQRLSDFDEFKLKVID